MTKESYNKWNTLRVYKTQTWIHEGPLDSMEKLPDIVLLSSYPCSDATAVLTRTTTEKSEIYKLQAEVQFVWNGRDVDVSRPKCSLLQTEGWCPTHTVYKVEVPQVKVNLDFYLGGRNMRRHPNEPLVWRNETSFVEFLPALNAEPLYRICTQTLNTLQSICVDIMSADPTFPYPGQAAWVGDFLAPHDWGLKGLALLCTDTTSPASTWPTLCVRKTQTWIHRLPIGPIDIPDQLSLSLYGCSDSTAVLTRVKEKHNEYELQASADFLWYGPDASVPRPRCSLLTGEWVPTRSLYSITVPQQKVDFDYFLQQHHFKEDTKNPRVMRNDICVLELQWNPLSSWHLYKIQTPSIDHLQSLCTVIMSSYPCSNLVKRSFTETKPWPG